LAGIEVIKVKMDSVVDMFVSGTQGQGFSACQSKNWRRTSSNPFNRFFKNIRLTLLSV
jgi:hypothetical protein